MPRKSLEKETKHLAAVCSYSVNAPQNSSVGLLVETHPTLMFLHATGTLVLGFVVGLSPNAGSEYTGVAIGTALLSIVYAGGATSGAHYNPGELASMYFCMH
jgi:hypothetical protein